MSDALDTGGAIDKLSKEAGILLVMLLAGGVALWFGWDQISAVFESQQKLQRAVEEVAKQNATIVEQGKRIAEIEKKQMGVDVDLMLLRKDTDANSYFSTNWPRGTIGALPDDAVQNTRLEYLEKRLVRLEISKECE
tara:strand:- start:11395 stop:11805 length:411 start_codon:yes stop_codon:yes gene_type:complete